MTESKVEDAVLRAAIDAAREAGTMLRDEFHRAGGPRGHGGHADVDVKVEQMLRKRLLSALPCGWLGEETGATPGTDGTWVVDPHDGTSDFLAGHRGSSVSIALVRDGIPVLGVVNVFGSPTDEDVIYAWAEGEPAVTRNGVPCPPLVDRALARYDVVAMSTSAAGDAAANAIALAPARFVTAPGPAHRLALVAAGEVVGAVSLVHGLASWDFAAGHALLRGAGATLLDGHGRPITYDAQGRSFVDGVFAGMPKVATELVSRPWSIVRDGRRALARPRIARVLGRPPGQERLSRALGCLMGQLAGDSLGSLVEFRDERSIAAEYPDGPALLGDVGTWNTLAGQPTDDSEMALALARSMIESKGYSAKAAFAAYVAWRRSGPFDIGTTTITALSVPFDAAGAVTKESQSNGALMRASPIGISAAGNPGLAAARARLDAYLTHPNPVCVEANAVYAAAIAVGVAGGTRAEMIDAGLSTLDNSPAGTVVHGVMEAAEVGPPTDMMTQQGWVLVALRTAFHHLIAGSSVEAGVRAAVKAGGDTDTNGAITGALLGAADGIEAIPAQWRRMVASCRPMMESGAHRPRPDIYWTDDYAEVAEALLTLRG